MSATTEPIRSELDAMLTDYQRRTSRVSVDDHQAARQRMADELADLVAAIRAAEPNPEGER